MQPGVILQPGPCNLILDGSWITVKLMMNSSLKFARYLAEILGKKKAW